MTVGELSEALMWVAVVGVIVGGFLLGLPVKVCAFALLGIVAALYFWGRP